MKFVGLKVFVSAYEGIDYTYHLDRLLAGVSPSWATGLSEVL